MYINCEVNKDTVYVWERHGKERRLVTYPCPWNCYIQDPRGKHKSLGGTNASFFEFDSRSELISAVRAANQRGIKTFESDVPPDLKVLSTHYANTKPPKLNVCYLDIEVDYRTVSYDPEHPIRIRSIKTPTKEASTDCGTLRDAADVTDFEVFDEKVNAWVPAVESAFMYCGPVGFSSIERPYAPINAIAMFTDWDKKTYVLAVPPPSWGSDPHKWDDMLDPELSKQGEIILCKDEKELLVLMLSIMQDADALCGWNSEAFDFPYIMQRVEIILGTRGLRKLSFPGAQLPKIRPITVKGRVMYTATYGGRLLMDYMLLFKKFEMATRPTYKLEAISEELMPQLKKLEYDGTLEQLYRRDFNHFLRYNLRDTECLYGFEKIQGYVSVAVMLYHMSTARFRDVAGTLRTADMSIINFCHETLGVIVPDAPVVEESGEDDEDEDEGAQGAYVLEPKAGMHENIGSIDITSLYPSAIRGNNISPEKLRGQFIETVEAFEHIRRRSDAKLTFQHEHSGEYETRTAVEWREWLIEKQYAISGYGTAFDLSEGQGVIPAILTEWFAKRKHYQKLKAQTADELEQLIKKYEQ